MMPARRQPLGRAISTWLRVVMPATAIVALYALALLGLELLPYLLAWAYEGRGASISDELSAACRRGRDAWLVLGLVGYSIYRVIGKHPFYRPIYAEWLSQTPWNSRLPLPLGPVHLLPQDAIPLLVAWLVSLDGSALTFPALATLLLAPYLIVMLFPLRVMGAVAHTYLIAYGLVTAVWIGVPSWSALLLLIALYLVAWQGLPISLRGFAWNVAPRMWEFVRPTLGQLGSSLMSRKSASTAYGGYPFAQLTRRPQLPELEWFEALLVAWLAAWGLSAVGSLIARADDRLAFYAMTILAGLVGTAIVRGWIYFGEYRPPISLLGRIFTGRWIVPGFDRAWFPLPCAVLVVVGTLYLTLPDYPSASGPLALGLGLSVLLAMPPSLKTWALTGDHRLVPNPSRKSEFMEI